MSKSDALKVLVELLIAGCVVALICYARVDLGMSWEQVNAQLKQWLGVTSMIAMAIWSQIIVAVVLFVGYKIWKHRSARQ